MKSYVVILTICAGLQASCFAQQMSPVTVSISISSQIVKVGAEIKVNISTTNMSTQAVSEYWASKPDDGEAEAGNDIQVFDAEGKTLPRIDGPVIQRGAVTYHLRKRSISRRVLSLEPGQTSSNFFILNNLFDLSRTGAYTIVVRHELKGVEDYIMIDASPNPLKITITE